MLINNVNFDSEEILKHTYELKEVLQLLAIVNVYDLPQYNVNNVADILLNKVYAIEEYIEQL